MGALISAIAGFSWVMHAGITSIFLFGESPYPSEEQEE